MKTTRLKRLRRAPLKGKQKIAECDIVELAEILRIIGEASERNRISSMTTDEVSPTIKTARAQRTKP
jgi:hypothetical protein